MMVPRLAMLVIGVVVLLVAAPVLAQSSYWRPFPSTVSPSAVAPEVPALGLTWERSIVTWRASETRFLALQMPIAMGSRMEGLQPAVGVSMSPMGLHLANGTASDDPGWFAGLLTGLTFSGMASTVPRPESGAQGGPGFAVQFDLNGRNPYQWSHMAHCLSEAALMDRGRESCYQALTLAVGPGYGRTLDRQTIWYVFEATWGSHSLASNMAYTWDASVVPRRTGTTGVLSGAYTYHGSTGRLPYALTGELGGTVTPMVGGRNERVGFTTLALGLGLPYGLTIGCSLRLMPMPDMDGGSSTGVRGLLTLGWGLMDGPSSYYGARHASAHPPSP